MTAPATRCAWASPSSPARRTERALCPPLSRHGRSVAAGDGAAVPLVSCAAHRAKRGGPGGSIGGKSAVRARPSLTASSSEPPITRVRRGLPPSPRGARGEREASPRIRSAEEPPVNPGPPGPTKSTHPRQGEPVPPRPPGPTKSPARRVPERKGDKTPGTTKSTISPRRESRSIWGCPSRRHQEPGPTKSTISPCRERQSLRGHRSRRHQEPGPTESTISPRRERAGQVADTTGGGAHGASVPTAEGPLSWGQR